MPTSLTLTALPEQAAVRIEITGAPAGDITLTRADVNGEADVRRMLGQEPISGVLTLIDYEPALTGLLAYRVVDSSAAQVTQSTTLAGSTSVPWVHDPVIPSARFSVPSSITGLSRSRESSSAVHHVIDREDPVVLYGPTRTPTGGVQMVATSWVEAMEMEAVLARGGTVMLRQPDYIGMDLYLVPSRVTVDPMSTEGQHVIWSVSVDYVAVSRPTDALVGAAGWDWSNVVSGYATWAAVDSAYATWNDLLVGP